MQAKDKIIIKKMIAYCDKLLNYTKDMDKENLNKDEMVTMACAFCLSQIGELAHQVSDELKESAGFSYPGIKFTVLETTLCTTMKVSI